MSNRLFTFLIFFVLILFSLSANEQDALAEEVQIQYAGSTSWNRINDVIIDGNYAYCAMPAGLKILDISNPKKPEPISQVYLELGAFSIDKNENLVLVGLRDSGLQIIDVSNPKLPVKLGWYESHCTAYTVKGYLDFAYVGCGTKIEVVSISNPNEPMFMGEFSFPFNHIPRDIKFRGDTAFVAASNVFILDISDPSQIKLITQFDTPYAATKLALLGDKLYVADRSPSTPPDNSSVLKLDISDITAPTIEANFEFDGNIFDLTVDSNFAYIAAGLSGIAILDITGPDMITVGCYRTTGFCDKISKFENNLLVVHENDELRAFDDYGINLCDSASTQQIDSGFQDIPSSLIILDISDKSLPKKVSFHKFFPHPYKSAIGIEYIYVANGGYLGIDNEGISIIDISSPDSLVEVSSLNLPGKCEFLFFKDNFVYTCNWEHGLFIIDVSNPRLPRVVGEFDTPGSALSVFVNGDYAFIADAVTGLLVVDISIPNLPLLVGQLPTNDYAIDIKIQDNVAYVADRFGGILIIDVVDPSSPQVISKFPQTNEPVLYTTVEVFGDKVASAGAGTVSIIDVAELTIPSELVRYFASGTISDIKVNDNLLYIALGIEGISIVDISIPDSLTLVSRLQTPGLALNLELIVDNLYISDYYSLVRLRILNGSSSCSTNGDQNLPIDFELFQNYPNPFNPSTTIEFSLSKKTEVNISILNILGQHIVTLVDKQMPAGNDIVVWDGSDSQGNNLSSGVYFYKLSTNEAVETKKMILLR